MPPASPDDRPDLGCTGELARSRLTRLRGLLCAEAIRRGPVTLASGRRSDVYVDCRPVALSAEGHFLIGWLLGRVVDRCFPRAEAIGGMALGAVPLASAAATLSFLGSRPLRAFYARKEQKGHGTEGRVEGLAGLDSGAEVLVVEDVVTSGGSSLRAAQLVREAGFRPAAVVALVDRGEGAQEAIAGAGLQLRSCFTLADLV